MNSQQLNQLNNMINNMNNVNICDSNCQKQKKVNRLRVQYNNAKNKLANAPAEIEATRKAYYLEDPKKGSAYYTQYMENKYKQDAQKEVNDWNNTLINPLVKQINDKITYYTSQKYYQNNVKDLYDNHKNNLETLKQKVENSNAKKYTNDRLAYLSLIHI